MDCPFCGHRVPKGVMDCPRCGGPAIPASAASAPHPDWTSPQPQPARGPDFWTSAPTGQELEAAARAPVPPEVASDPEAGLRTEFVQGDRQEALATKIVEPPPAAPKPAAAAQATGLPDSRVARGVEDSLLEVKRFFFRLGAIGRLAFAGHAVVIVGAVLPWYYMPHQGYTPGLEQWGWLPFLLSAAGLATLGWRFRRVPGARVLPVLAHLALSAGVVLSMLWVWKWTTELPDHLETRLAAGVYVSAAGAALAAVGALLGVKDVR